MTPEQKDPRPFFKQPTFYFVFLAFALFIYAQWPKNEVDEYISQIGDSEYSINFIQKPSLKTQKDSGLWMYRASVSGVKFAVRYQKENPNISVKSLQDLALESFDRNSELFEFVVAEPTQYEKGYFWSIADEKGRVRESLWVLAENGWLEILSVYDSNKEGHEQLAIDFSQSLFKH